MENGSKERLERADSIGWKVEPEPAASGRLNFHVGLRASARGEWHLPGKNQNLGYADQTSGQCIFCQRVVDVETFRDLVVFENAEFLISHQIGENGTKALGVLHFQTKRHASSLGELNPTEAEQLGPLLSAASRAIETVTGAPWTYCFGFTEGPRHVHLVLGARYATLPEKYRRLRFAEWPESPRGDRTALAKLCASLRREMGPEDRSRR
jgi:histidine triad (HIT) family protein